MGIEQWGFFRGKGWLSILLGVTIRQTGILTTLVAKVRIKPALHPTRGASAAPPRVCSARPRSTVRSSNWIFGTRFTCWETWELLKEIGRGEWIRTTDLLV